MKAPKRPQKPYSPCKLVKPSEQIQKNETVSSVNLSNYHSYSLQEFNDLIKQNANGHNPQDLQLEFIAETNMYDGCIDLSITIYKNELINNPSYDNLLKQYQKDLDKYNKDYNKYLIASKRYKEDMRNFEKDNAKYQLECCKNAVKKWEKLVKTENN